MDSNHPTNNQTNNFLKGYLYWTRKVCARGTFIDAALSLRGGKKLHREFGYEYYVNEDGSKVYVHEEIVRTQPSTSISDLAA